MFQKIILIVAINTYERTFKVAPSAPERIAENNSLVVLDRDISFTLPCNFFPFVDFVFSSCVPPLYSFPRGTYDRQRPRTPEEIKTLFPLSFVLTDVYIRYIGNTPSCCLYQSCCAKSKKDRKTASERERERQRDILPEEEVVCSCEWIRVQELGVLEQWRGKLERESAEERGELKKEEESPGGI